MRLLVFADVHVRPDRLDDQRHTLEQIARVAVDEHVDSVLFAGDMFDGPVVSPPQYLMVRRALLEPLAEARIPLYGVSGNGKHDSAGTEGEDNALAVLHEGSDALVQIATRPGIWPVDDGAETSCVLAMLPWVSSKRLVASLNGGGDRDTVDATASDLVLRIAEGQALRLQGFDVPKILLGHWATTGWRTPTGLPTDELRDVVLPLERLEALGFDAVVLGHIHSPGLIGMSDKPTLALILSPGSPLCLNHGEANDDHGCWLLDFGGGGCEATFVQLDYRPFVTLDFDFVAEPDFMAFVLVSDFLRDPPVDAVVRFRYRATAEQAHHISHAALEAALLAAGAHSVKIEATIDRPSRARVAEASEELGVGEALELWLGAQDPPVDEALAEKLRAWVAE